MRLDKRLILVLSVALICFALAFSTSLYLAQSRAKTITITEAQTIQVNREYREKVESLLHKVMSWVEEHRGLMFKENVSLEVLTKSWVIEHWGKGFLNVTEVKIEETILKSLFIIPEDFNLTAFKIKTSGYTIAASAGHTIYVVEDLFNPDDEPRASAILAHELTHVLQGEYFEIPQPETSDEKNAILALVEGDANLVAHQYVLERSGSSGSAVWERSIRPIDALWYFPYLYGEQFVEYVYRRKGWSGVNAVYEDPPRSTAEILHPEKYLSGWRPVRVSTSSVNGSWKLLMKDTLGEFFIREMLRSHLDFGEANRSAEGWLGDSIYLYKGGNESYLIKWRIAWETPEDAEEFYHSFTSLLSSVGAAEAGPETWITPYERVVLKLSGNETLITITAPPMKESSAEPILA